MQSVFRFVPDDALGTVDDFRRNFFAAMCGEAMHKERFGFGDGHLMGINLPVGEILEPFGVFRFEAHAGPNVGGDQVGIAASIQRIGKFFVVVGAIQTGALRLHLIAGWGGDMHIKAKDLGGLQPSVADVIGITYPGHCFALDGTPMFDKGVDVRQDLAGVVFVGQAVDHGNARMRGKSLNDRLLESADHHDVNHARHHTCHVFDRLAARKLGVAPVQVDGDAAQLIHAGFERHPGAGRGLLEHHGQGAIPERLINFIAFEALFDPAGAREKMLQLLAGKVLELQEVTGRMH